MWRFIAGRRPLPLFSRSVWQTTRTYASPSFVPSKQPRPRPSMAKLAFVGFFPIAAFGLGTWQMKRLRWKVELIEMLEERVSLPAVPLPRRIRPERYAELEYRRFKVRGTFLHDQEIQLGPRSRGEGAIGYFIVTPFRRENGQVILVKRGWVARDKKDPSTRPESLIQGTVEVEGMLRQSEMRNMFSPSNQPEKQQWFMLDVEDMSRHTGADPILLEEISDESPSVYNHLIDKGIPVGRPPTVEVRNMHAQYAATWYSLSALTAIMFYTMVRRPARVAQQLKSY